MHFIATVFLHWGWRVSASGLGVHGFRKGVTYRNLARMLCMLALRRPSPGESMKDPDTWNPNPEKLIPWISHMFAPCAEPTTLHYLKHRHPTRTNEVHQVINNMSSREEHPAWQSHSQARSNLGWLATSPGQISVVTVCEMLPSSGLGMLRVLLGSACSCSMCTR